MVATYNRDECGGQRKKIKESTAAVSVVVVCVEEMERQAKGSFLWQQLAITNEGTRGVKKRETKARHRLPNHKIFTCRFPAAFLFFINQYICTLPCSSKLGVGEVVAVRGKFEAFPTLTVDSTAPPHHQHNPMAWEGCKGKCAVSFRPWATPRLSSEDGRGGRQAGPSSAPLSLIHCLTFDPTQTNTFRHTQHKHFILFQYGRRSCTRGACIWPSPSSVQACAPVMVLSSLCLTNSRGLHIPPTTHPFITGSEIAFLLDARGGLAKGRDRRL